MQAFGVNVVNVTAIVILIPRGAIAGSRNKVSLSNLFFKS